MAEIYAAANAPDPRLPLVTVAMPVFNAGRYLRPAVMSIIQQTFREWELLLIDDGSTDGAVEAVKDLFDQRIRVLSDGENKGLAARLNEAIDLARGRYFARMDQDDISYPERLARQLEMLEQNQELDLVAVRCLTIDAENRINGALPAHLTNEAICSRPWLSFHLPHPTWMGKIAWFRRHRYSIPGPYFCEDQELLLRSYRVSKFATVPEVLFAYRVRNKLNLTKTLKTRWTLMRIQLRHFNVKRQWYFFLATVFAFAGRAFMDSLTLIGQILGGSGFQRYRAAIDPAELQKWQALVCQMNLVCK